VKFVMAPDSFKESMTAQAAARAMADGVREAFPDAECVEAPIADGGEGLTAALAGPLGLREVRAPARDPLGRPIVAAYGLAGDLAVIEVAAAAGLELVSPSHRDVMGANTAGLADLVRDAQERGAARFLIGLGGSATVDGGAGLLAGLGARFFDAAGKPVPPLPHRLEEVARIDLGDAAGWGTGRVEAACDVTNPLLGEAGAASVFGPQKGASPAQVEALDRGLGRFAAALEAASGIPVREAPGAGAAGGLGAALLALGARLRPGADLVIEATGLEKRLAGADFVFTGEGSLDGQTQAGKAPAAVARLAAKLGVPCVALAGKLGPGAEDLAGPMFSQVIQITPPDVPLAQALRDGPANLRTAAAAEARRLASPGHPPA
jgi:glycerate kinase